MGQSQSVDEFCREQKLSRATYYNLKRISRGPVELVIGGIRRITPEAAAEWQARMIAEPIIGGVRKAAQAAKAEAA